jgi:hypothetical protein
LEGIDLVSKGRHISQVEVNIISETEFKTKTDKQAGRQTSRQADRHTTKEHAQRQLDASLGTRRVRKKRDKEQYLYQTEHAER